jgi:hypothetical protein
VTKTCSRCKQAKPLADFYPRTKGVPGVCRKTTQWNCKDCGRRASQVAVRYRRTKALSGERLALAIERCENRLAALLRRQDAERVCQALFRDQPQLAPLEREALPQESS